ncbi:unnamed protein product [Paramecium pentaurelia]|uniref:S1 motif domain-containing protein n=1 Tax=Paramecium pentaurelia TaxID=43138 RepID=A0A8S1SJU0_9CILI|nr:unnamed protein product [Paramecium pentaurelia]
MQKVYFPGELIRHKNELQSGIGTYVKDDKIYASMQGSLTINEQLISIFPSHQQDPELKIGSIIIGQVNSIREDRVFVRILKINGVKVNNYIEGVLRKQNIRLHEIDLLEMNKCYLPGDIIKARMISYGDSLKLYLSTAEDELGVLFAKHQETQKLMIPLSWDEMLCVESGLKEKRKVAKPNFNQLV